MILACNASSPLSPFDQAQEMTRDMGRARELYDKAAASDPDPDRRERAILRSAFIDWYVFHDMPAARVKLAKIPEASRNAAAASLERARLELELAQDYTAARNAAARALKLATKTSDSDEARIISATATIEESWQTRLRGTCPNDADAVRAAARELEGVIDAAGPVVDTSRRLLDASILIRDDAGTLKAWRWYYSDHPAIVPAAVTDRRALAMGLAASRLFEEADMVLRDPCGSTTIDEGVRDLVAYAKMLRRLRMIIHEQHRALAQGRNKDAFHKDIEAEMKALWPALTWAKPQPKFSFEAARAELGRRFGLVMTVGKTEGQFDMVYGHEVRSEKREVEQYGHRAPIRFTQIDGLIAGGYLRWITHGASGTGGWNNKDEIVQLRPSYADGPVKRWRRITDPGLRKEREELIADETRRDEARAKQTPVAHFRGLELRLQQQYAERLRDSLAATGLAGDALREAFLTRVHREQFESSIWAHEGRHAIDTKIFKIDSTKELEYRAKLSEITFAPGPRGAFGGILSPIGGPTAHGDANERALKGVERWMRAHAKEISGLDATKALVPQMDRLTDEQLKETFRSQDPFATQRRR